MKHALKGSNAQNRLFVLTDQPERLKNIQKERRRGSSTFSMAVRTIALEPRGESVANVFAELLKGLKQGVLDEVDYIYYISPHSR